MRRKKSMSSSRKKTVGQKLKSQAGATAKELIQVFLAVLLLNSFVMASFEVPSSSMEDTVKIGDRLLVNKFVYGGSTPYTVPFTSIRMPHFRVPGLRRVERGDVIVFDWPGDRDQTDKPTQVWYVKRCIALPGDEVQITDRVVRVNATISQYPQHVKFLRRWSIPAGYRNSGIFPRGSTFNEDNYGPIVVPRRGMRLDLTATNASGWAVLITREGHTVAVDGDKVRVDGRETTSYQFARDYLFAMGDNRDNSLDSRFWGFVPMEDVIGTPMIVYWSWNPDIPIYDLLSKIGSIDFTRIGTVIR